MNLNEQQKKMVEGLLDETPNANQRARSRADDNPSPFSEYGLLGNGRASLTPSPLLSGVSSPHLAQVGDERPMDVPGLIAGLRAIHIREGREAAVGLPRLPMMSFGNIPVDPSLFRANLTARSHLGLGGDDNGYDVSRLSVSSVLPALDAEREMYVPGLQQHCYFIGHTSQPRLSTSQPNSHLRYPNGVRVYDDGVHGRNYYLRGSQDVGFAPLVDQRMRSQQNGDDPDLSTGLSGLHYSSQLLNGRAGSSPDGWAHQLPSLARTQDDNEVFVCEESLIIPGKGLCYVGNNNRGDLVKERKKKQADDRLHLGGIPVINNGSGYSPRSHNFPNSLLNGDVFDSKRSIYYIAKDQHGCRLLQQKFDEGKPQVDAIFAGVIDYVAELMVNPFGNYLIQKLLDVCSEEQRIRIIVVLTKDPMELVRISLNIHGTRAVQKLIETLKTRQQIALVIAALQPGFLDLIKDLNGNHVVQRCLQTLSAEDNKFIFDAAAKYCVDIATHRHGCCVLQRCIAHSTGKQRANLVAEISANGLHLAQDAYGNYVIQYILDLKIPSAIADLVFQFEGNYVQLSMQKFSSNVVEKCIKVFGENDRARIIVELLSVSRFEQLLQDPYANYVIQSALAHSKDSLHAALVEAIRPHAAVLRSSPYCKRIFSRNLKK